MVRALPETAWPLFLATVSPEARRGDEPALPSKIAYLGAIDGGIGYVLPDAVLRRLSAWMASRGEQEAWYFLTEYTEDDTDQSLSYGISAPSLCFDELFQLNPSSESVLTVPTLEWAIRTLASGVVHVAGPPELLDLIEAGFDELGEL